MNERFICQNGCTVLLDQKDKRIAELEDERDTWKMNAEIKAIEMGFIKEGLREAVNGNYEKSEEWLEWLDKYRKGEVTVEVNWKPVGDEDE